MPGSQSQKTSINGALNSLNMPGELLCRHKETRYSPGNMAGRSDEQLVAGSAETTAPFEVSHSHSVSYKASVSVVM
jgi:hypothetical protein